MFCDVLNLSKLVLFGCIFGLHGHHAILSRCGVATVMHDAQVIIWLLRGATIFCGKLVLPVPIHDVVPEDCNVLITIWTFLLVTLPESVHDLMCASSNTQATWLQIHVRCASRRPLVHSNGTPVSLICRSHTNDGKRIAIFEKINATAKLVSD